MADNLDVKDAAAATKTLRTKDLGSQHLPYHAIMDSSGAEMLGEKVTASSVPVVFRPIMALARPRHRQPERHDYATSRYHALLCGRPRGELGHSRQRHALSFGSSARYSTGAGRIVRARISKTDPSLTNAQFRLHLYSAAPTGIANGDNAAWSTNIAGYLGSIDVTLDRAFVDGAYGDAELTAGIYFKLASGSSLKGLLEARATYTPASAEVFTVTLEIEQT
jgi:hypothetical protein